MPDRSLAVLISFSCRCSKAPAGLSFGGGVGMVVACEPRLEGRGSTAGGSEHNASFSGRVEGTGTFYS